MVAREAAGLAEDHVAVAGIGTSVRGAVGKDAPTIRSSKPSPLTSPAEDTEQPDWSTASSPWSTKPWLPSPAVMAARSMVAAKPPALPKIT